MKIKIKKCTDPSAWYANRIGETIEAERLEVNRSRSQGLPENVYWCREGGKYNPLNYIRQSDTARCG